MELVDKQYKLLEEMLSVTRELSVGNYSKRIVTTYSDSLMNELARNINTIADQMQLSTKVENESGKSNVDFIGDAIVAFGNHDFSHQLPISNQGTILDAISIGINMLGNELEYTYITRDFFKNIFDSVSEILFVFDARGNLTYVNKIGNSFFGIVDKYDYEIELSEKSTSLLQPILIAMDTFVNANEIENKFELAIIDSLENEIITHCSISRIFDKNKNHKGFLFIARDITEQKNKKIDDLKIIISTQESERKRLAFDLHDSLGQEINAVGMYLNLLASMKSSTKIYKETFETSRYLLNSAIKNIREISFNLMPKSLEEGGLWFAIKEFTNRLQHLCAISYIEPSCEIDIDNESKITIYRIIQEFVNNSLKHASAKNITITFSNKKGKFQFQLEDNGVGFNLDSVIYGNGLNNLKTRLDSLKAEYLFKSDLKKGTVLTFTIEQK